ncbi:MAG: ABC transporter permease [Clostridiales bacterium]|nr:ABC transporter permease [Clostridiales bacterium]
MTLENQTLQHGQPAWDSPSPDPAKAPAAQEGPTLDEFRRLTAAEQDSDFIAMESKTYLQDAWSRLKRNRLAMFGLIVVSLIILTAIIGPMVSPYAYDEFSSSKNAMPSAQHIFGTDKFGRDIFTRIMYGARISLSVGIAAAMINLVIGIVYGGIAGYLGGRVDLYMMRVVDILYSIPTMLYVILIMLMFGANIISIMIGICVSSWVGMARIVRSQVMSLKQQEFAMAAQVMGASTMRILVRHLILNSMGPIIVTVTLMIPQAIFTEAFLSFVGVGISAPQASWGTLAQNAKQVIDTYPVQVIWPVAAICVTMLSLNFVGDGLTEALDPKKK